MNKMQMRMATRKANLISLSILIEKVEVKEKIKTEKKKD